MDIKDLVVLGILIEKISFVVNGKLVDIKALVDKQGNVELETLVENVELVLEIIVVKIRI